MAVVKPLIVPIVSDAAKPFVTSYCEQYGVPSSNAPNFGFDILWYGCVWRGDLRAVLGVSAIPEGMYVHGFFGDKSPFERRALFALYDWVENLDIHRWAHVHETNTQMWYRLLKSGWQIGMSKPPDLLLHKPSVIQCQENTSKD